MSHQMLGLHLAASLGQNSDSPTDAHDAASPTSHLVRLKLAGSQALCWRINDEQ